MTIYDDAGNGMTRLYAATGAATAVELEAVYAIVDGHPELIHTKPELPQITSMSVNPRYILGAGAQDLTVSFTVTGSVHNEIHRTIGDVTVARPLTTSTRLTEPAPASDAVYRLDSRNNANDSVSRSVRFTRAAAAGIAYFRNDGIVVSQIARFQYAQLAFRVTGHPLPSVRITTRGGLDERPHVLPDGTGILRVDHAAPLYNPGNITYQLAAQVQVDGENVGTVATSDLNITWR